MSETKKPVLVCYHGGDCDGVLSAYAAWLKFGDVAEYRPVAADAVRADDGQALAIEADGRQLVLLDLPVTKAGVWKLLGSATRLTVIDHHASSAAELACDQTRMSLPNGPNLAHLVVLDTTHAACVLAWQYFCPLVAVPKPVLYAEDRDLWRHELPHSRTVNAGLALALLGRDPGPELWQACEAACASLGQLEARGAAVLAWQAQEVRAHAARALVITVAGHQVPACNCTAHVQSELGDALLAQYPQAPFAATYTVTGPGRYVWSLRSRLRHGPTPGTRVAEFDVAALAAQWGGGGHACAAGFTAPADDPFARGTPPPRGPAATDAEEPADSELTADQIGASPDSEAAASEPEPEQRRGRKTRT